MAKKKRRSHIFEVSSYQRQRQDCLNHDYISSTLFVVPCNDGEAARALQILESVPAPYLHISKQGWGATLDQELALLSQDTLTQVKRVCLFELPGVAGGLDEDIASEAQLRQRGLEVDIVDHHHYEWVDRHNSLSSLEQLCQRIGWQMDDDDIAIAVNDRAYIPGMVSLGLGIDQMRKVRQFDFESQGQSKTAIERQLKQAKLHIRNNLQKREGIWVLDKPEYCQPYIVQELSFMMPRGLVDAFEIKPHKVGFSGSPEVVAMLLKLDLSSWEATAGPLLRYGGGDGGSSKYWAVKCRTKGQKLPEGMSAMIWQAIVAFRQQLAQA